VSERRESGGDGITGSRPGLTAAARCVLIRPRRCRRRTETRFPTNGREIVVIRNADAAGHTCTIPVSPAAAPDGLTEMSRVITVSAGKTFVAGPFGPEYRRVGGSVYLNWSSATRMTVGVLRLPS